MKYDESGEIIVVDDCEGVDGLVVVDACCEYVWFNNAIGVD